MSLNDISQIRGPGIHTESHIVSEDITLTGIATASNFKTGTSNVHNVGIEIAGINVLGADTPIGHGATIYNSGAAVFAGVVTASTFSGPIVAGAGVSDLSAGITTVSKLHVGGATTFGEDLVVTGDARVTGILTIGTGSITIDPSDDSLSLGQTKFKRDSSSGDLEVVDKSGNRKGIRANELYIGGNRVLDSNRNAKSGLKIPASLITSGRLDAARLPLNAEFTSANITGDMTVAGKLTYEDVANVDAIGVVTGRSGFHASGGVFRGSGSGLTGVANNFVTAVGIQSEGLVVGTGITNLRFVGTGNSITVNGDTAHIKLAGDTGQKGQKGEIGVKGQKGEKGEKGQKGEKGIKGQKGEIGQKGDKGNIGDVEAKGNKGQKGETGADGNNATGTKGEKGAPSTVVGPKGDKGQKGEVGVTGATGDKGQKGELGAQGPQGQKGQKGDQGEKGEKGQKGVTGNTGPQGATGGGAPTGQIIAWSGSASALPTGYFLCDGSAISRTTYEALFNIVGTTHGNGDGSSTFNLPEPKLPPTC